MIEGLYLKDTSLAPAEIAKRLDCKRSTVTKQLCRIRAKGSTATKLAIPQERMPLDEREQVNAQLANIKESLTEERKRTEYWMKEAARLKQNLGTYESTWDHVPHQYSIPVSRGSRGSTTTPVLLCSDWHVEEPVDPASILDANEYSLDIADRSIKTLASTTLRLIELKRAGTRIDTLVVWLGGDFVTGHIHEENLAHCSLSPIEAILWTEDRIYSMLQFLLKEGGFKQIVVPCSCGNHARTTKKKHISLQAETNFEWGMYNHLSRAFKDDKRVKFVLSPGYFTTVELYQRYKLRFHHGDAVKFGGGVGGLTIPLNKRIAQWNANGREVYLDCLGHWHSYMPGRKAIVNSSLIGYNAFAQECGFAVEPPTQTLFFVEEHRGLTGIEPIFVR